MAKKDQSKPEDELDVDVAPEGDAGLDAEVTVEAADGAEDWKEQLEAAKRTAQENETKRIEAERLAQQRAADIDRMQREAAQTRSDVVSAEMLAINNAIANTDHERSDAKLMFKTAMEAGDFEAAAEAQAKFSEIASKAQRLKEGKAEIERRSEAARSAPDPVEQYASTLPPRAAAWIRSHPETITDSAKKSQLLRSHHRALADGIVEGSDEYFQSLDIHMGYVAKPAVEDTEVDVQPPVRQPVAPAAPVSRGGAAQASNPRPNTVRLTAAQREIAAACGLTDAEYARQLVAIQRGATTH